MRNTLRKKGATPYAPFVHFFRGNWEIAIAAAYFAMMFVIGYVWEVTAPSWVPTYNFVGFAGLLFHNLLVALLVIAGGLLFALPSILITGTNAMMMGAFFAIFPLDMRGFLHFPLEVCAIILALATSFRVMGSLIDWMNRERIKPGLRKWVAATMAVMTIAVVVEWVELECVGGA